MPILTVSALNIFGDSNVMVPILVASSTVQLTNGEVFVEKEARVVDIWPVFPQDEISPQVCLDSPTL